METAKLHVKCVNTKSILCKSNLPGTDYCANPYIGCTHACKYCYASYMAQISNHQEQWGSFVDIKSWEAIGKPTKYYGKTVFIGTVTDAYQPCEAKYGRTRSLLEQLIEYEIKIVICTKSDLVLRDLDLIKMFPKALVAFSINTLCDDFRKSMECTVSIERRITAMKACHDAGIQTACFIAPIFPKITDVNAIIKKVKDKCHFVWLENLNLRNDYKSRILSFIYNKYRTLYQLYYDIYVSGNISYWYSLEDEIFKFCKVENYKYVHTAKDFFLHPQSYSDKSLIVVNCFHYK